jgi:hypothetical protein
MSDYIWFKLFIRGIGLLLIGLALPSFVSLALWTVQTFIQSDGQWVQYVFLTLLNLAAFSIQLAMGVYLFLGGQRVIRFCLRDVVNRCAFCAYDLRGIKGDVCPECGLTFVAPPDRTTSPPGAS